MDRPRHQTERAEQEGGQDWPPSNRAMAVEDGARE